MAFKKALSKSSMDVELRITLELLARSSAVSLQRRARSWSAWRLKNTVRMGTVTYIRTVQQGLFKGQRKIARRETTQPKLTPYSNDALVFCYRIEFSHVLHVQCFNSAKARQCVRLTSRKPATSPT
jgi:hypothetical protein